MVFSKMTRNRDLKRNYGKRAAVTIFQGVKSSIELGPCAQRKWNADAHMSDASETRTCVTGRGHYHQAHDEGVIDEAVKVELELEAVIDNGQVEGQEVVLVGDDIPWI